MQCTCSLLQSKLVVREADRGTCRPHSVWEPLCDVLCLNKAGKLFISRRANPTAPFMAGNYKLSHIREDMDPRSID
jgi:hypothetical protein